MYNGKIIVCVGSVMGSMDGYASISAASPQIYKLLTVEIARETSRVFISVIFAINLFHRRGLSSLEREAINSAI